MSKQLQQKDKPTESEKPQPEHQDAIDMLINWIEMARAIGMGVDALFNPKNNRFTVRVENTVYENGEIKVKL